MSPLCQWRKSRRTKRIALLREGKECRSIHRRGTSARREPNAKRPSEQSAGRLVRAASFSSAMRACDALSSPWRTWQASSATRTRRAHQRTAVEPRVSEQQLSVQLSEALHCLFRRASCAHALRGCFVTMQPSLSLSLPISSPFLSLSLSYRPLLQPHG